MNHKGKSASGTRAVSSESIAARKRTAQDWFAALRDDICAAFETLETRSSGGRATEQ